MKININFICTVIFLFILSLVDAVAKKINNKEVEEYYRNRRVEYFTFTCPTAEEVEIARNKSRGYEYIVNKEDDIYFLASKEEKGPFTFKEVVFPYGDIFCLYESINHVNLSLLPRSKTNYIAPYLCHVKEAPLPPKKTKYLKFCKNCLNRFLPKRFTSSPQSSLENEAETLPTIQKLSPDEHEYEREARVYQSDNPNDIPIICEKSPHDPDG